MDIEQALVAVSAGKRITASHLAKGGYVEATPTGVMRVWPVDRPEDEWQRSQCLFARHPEDEAADWKVITPARLDSRGKVLKRPVVIPPEEEALEVKARRSRWGKTSEEAQLIAIEQERARRTE